MSAAQFGDRTIFRISMPLMEGHVLAHTGLSFDLSTTSGKFMRTIMAGLVEFDRTSFEERDGWPLCSPVNTSRPQCRHPPAGRARTGRIKDACAKVVYTAYSDDRLEGTQDHIETRKLDRRVL